MKERHDLLDALQLSPAILTQFVLAIPEDRLDLRRGKGFWTIAEHVSHLAQVQPLLLERMERFVTEDSPAFVPFLPDDGAANPAPPPRMVLDAALEQFADCRNRQLHLLKQADEAAWCKKSIHPEYELYTLHILTRHLLMHDHWHMYRMEELWLTRDQYLTRLD